MYNLAGAVRALAPEAYDSHLFALEVRANALKKKIETHLLTSLRTGPATRAGSRVGIIEMTSFCIEPVVKNIRRTQDKDDFLFTATIINGARTSGSYN